MNNIENDTANVAKHAKLKRKTSRASRAAPALSSQIFAESSGGSKIFKSALRDSSDRQALTPWKQWASGVDSETALAPPMLSIQANDTASATVSQTAHVNQQSNAVADLQSGNVALEVQTEQLARSLNALSLENAQLWSEQQVQDAEYRRCASLEEMYESVRQMETRFSKAAHTPSGALLFLPVSSPPEDPATLALAHRLVSRALLAAVNAQHAAELEERDRSLQRCQRAVQRLHADLPVESGLPPAEHAAPASSAPPARSVPALFVERAAASLQRRAARDALARRLASSAVLRAAARVHEEELAEVERGLLEAESGRAAALAAAAEARERAADALDALERSEEAAGARAREAAALERALRAEREQGAARERAAGLRCAGAERAAEEARRRLRDAERRATGGDAVALDLECQLSAAERALEEGRRALEEERRERERAEGELAETRERLECVEWRLGDAGHLVGDLRNACLEALEANRRASAQLEMAQAGRALREVCGQAPRAAPTEAAPAATGLAAKTRQHSRASSADSLDPDSSAGGEPRSARGGGRGVQAIVKGDAGGVLTVRERRFLKERDAVMSNLVELQASFSATLKSHEQKNRKLGQQLKLAELDVTRLKACAVMRGR